MELPIENALLVLREEHRQRTDSYTTYLAHGGKGDPAEEVGLDALAMAISVLKQQQEQESKPLNEWISVKDKLPEKDGNYIVTACDEGCSAGEGIWHSTVVVVAECYKGSWTWYDEYSLEGIVTHWMPLPNPPKGE